MGLIDTINKIKSDDLIDIIKQIAIRKKYTIFDKGDYNLNIWNVRATDKTVDIFNDVQIVFYKFNGVQKVHIFRITTDPGKDSLIKPMNPNGTFIMKPNQYLRCWTFGYHKNDKSHPALVQCAPVTGYRDNNKDSNLDISDKTLVTGMFGVNCHRASAWRILERIGLYSAGCQVHYDPNRYNKEFIPLLKESIIRYANVFSMTLIDEEDLYV